MRVFSIVAGASVVAAAPRASSAPPTYPGGGETPQEMQQRAAAVKEAFQFAWNGYYKYAFPNDELLPVTNGFDNTRNGWGASAIDALSTALVMGNKQVVNQIINHVPSIDFSKSINDTQVSLFETTIRYIGGLLSGYDLLNGPLKSLANDKTKIPILLQQATNLANNLSFAFDTPSGVPSNNLYFNNKTNDGSTTNGLATVGTLVLEWTRLSDLTGNPSYAQKTQKAQSYILNPQPASSSPWNGLLGSDIYISNGSFADDNGSWNGGDDSAYEYLIKMFVYDQSRFTKNRDRWIAAADSSIAHLASHPQPRPDLTFLAGFDGKTLDLSSGHLACFDGGNFILAGTVLKQQKYVDFGIQLVESCEDLYNNTLTGIGPDGFAWDPTQVPADQKAFYQKAGFYITSGAYLLRPEVIESFYYAYRATGKRRYQDYAWNAFKAINATARVGSGFSEISDVQAANGGAYYNFQESFLFAEVMKYAYIIHAPDAVWQYNHAGANQYVFNTEAHPLKVAGTPV